MDLYLVPRCVDLIRIKVRFPSSVNNFILHWDTLKDPTKLRKVWACAIYYLQAELRKTGVMKKAIESLKIWCTTNYTNQIKELRIDIEKAGASLGTILELEGRLESIFDAQYSTSDVNKQSLDLNFNNIQNGIRYWNEKMASLHNEYRNLFDQWVENIGLKPILTTELEEL
jgi:hypothetical protein